MRTHLHRFVVLAAFVAATGAFTAATGAWEQSWDTKWERRTGVIDNDPSSPLPQTIELFAPCAPGERVLGGGFNNGSRNPDVVVNASEPAAVEGRQGWRIAVTTPNREPDAVGPPQVSTVKAVAVCTMTQSSETR
jgi:hypothetical protein